MPLLVHCPNRCQIRVPANRMGKVIRCIDCQTPIRIPDVQSPLLRTGNWVECRARRAIKKAELAKAAGLADRIPAPSPTANNGGDSAALPIKPLADPQPSESLTLQLPQRTARLLRAKPWRTVEPLTHVDPEDVLTPIELGDLSTRIEKPTDRQDMSDNLELANEHVSKIDHEDTLVSRLLCFVNPFARRSKRSA